MQRDNQQYPMTNTLMEGERYAGIDTQPYFIQIGCPALDTQLEQGDYYCPIDIRRHNMEEQHLVAFGINPLQALEMAFEAIRLSLPYSGDDSFQKVSVDYLVHVHTLPDDLAAALKDSQHELYDTAVIYQRLIKNDQLWPIWQIDCSGQLWVEVNFFQNGEHCFHTIKLDEGSYDKVETEPYWVGLEITS